MVEDISLFDFYISIVKSILKLYVSSNFWNFTVR